MQWIADRFFTVDDTWIDAASGEPVRLHLTAPDGDDAVGWNEQCAQLANLRHPLLNTLIDYGRGPNGCCFEAYERREARPSAAADPLGERALEHLATFLRTHHVAMPAARASFALRAVVARGGGNRPAVGVTIQGRRALEAVEEALDAATPAGPAVISVSGVSHAGLRTLRTLVARSARLRGFVPLTPAAAGRHPRLIDMLLERHVCLLDDLQHPARSSPGVSRLIAGLAAASARRHVVVRFRREPPGQRRGIALDPLSVRSLVSMVFPDQCTSEAELFAAARDADGLPGVFLARLGGTYPHASGAAVVHETATRYGAGSSVRARVPSVLAGRVLGSALRARPRAVHLARAGRHAAAIRLLKRGMRVLEGRERRLEAADCAMHLGWLSLDRGATGAARQYFGRARELAADESLGVSAVVGLGVALTDENRLIEAEAVLRGAIAAADTIQVLSIVGAAAAALARCLLWQDRFEEAAAVASTYRAATADAAPRARLVVALARTCARLGRASEAVRLAREAQTINAAPDGHVQVSVELGLAEALDSAGDREGAQAARARALRIARAHHLPLARVRVALLALAGPAEPDSRVIRRLHRINLPPLLASRLKRAMATPASRPLEPVAELEKLLDLSQRAADDGTATAQVCQAVAERLGAHAVALFGGDDRRLALHGRGWAAVPDVVRQVMATGAPVRPDGRREPQECAEPVRYGGEVIGALACRWVAGATVDGDRAGVLLRAAALSAAPHVRVMLDQVPPPPTAGWGDLLGQSPGAMALRDAVMRAARAPFPVLVEGESGCGKELVARALHRLSQRRDRRFCALNCAALTDDLVETELFGHARGAFTGAATERAGLFEEADGGTLFLDEVGELSARAQAKLLRVLQEGEVRRVGENLSRRVDVRVVAATNRRLEQEAAAGRFRTDLRFRLDVVRITVPPLRERPTDIPVLAAHFWQDASSRVGSRATLSGEALSALARYDWPGNVRELQNVIAWIAVESPRRGRIGPSALPRHVAKAAASTACSFEAAREEFERRFVRAALAGANGQRGRAAEAMGVSRQGLSKMMRRLRIDGI